MNTLKSTIHSELETLKGLHILNSQEEAMIQGGTGEDDPGDGDPNNPDSKWVAGKPGSGIV